MHKSRLFLTFLLLSLLFAALAYGVSSRIVLDGVDSIELRQAIKSMEHMHERLALSQSGLSWQVRANACSDALYEQLKAPKGPDMAFLNEKFAPEFLNSLQVTALTLFGEAGQPLFLTLGATSYFSEEQLACVEQTSAKIVYRLMHEGGVALEGLVNIEGEAYLMAAHKIYDADLAKKPQGVLLMIKRLEREFGAGAETNSFLRFSVLPKASFDAVPAEVDAESGYKILEENDEIFVYALERDVFGVNVCCMESRGERLFSAFARSLAENNFFFMLAIGLLLLASAIVLMHRCEQRVMEQEILRRSRHDGVTGLYNRSYAETSLREMIAEADRSNEYVGVIFLNLDRFRGINDKYGYEVGDKILCETAARLASIGEKAMIARYEGDKFVMIAKDANKEILVGRAQSALEVMCELFKIGGNEIMLTSSLGLAFFPINGKNPGNILRRAEIAMYQAQKRGRGRLCVFSNEMEEEATRRVSMQIALTQALDEETLLVFYQPKVDVLSKRVVGCEALIRWQREDGRFVPPPDFIPLAEEMGLVTRIDMFVLDTACRQVKAWKELGLDVRIAVNMSAYSILSEGFAERVQQILHEEGILPQCIELEITETSLMTELDVASAAIAKLYNSGIKIALDDFGTGYSSLRYLHSMPISCLKIDKSFVDGLSKKASREDSSELISGILALATGIGKDMVAEGVEEASQLDFIVTHGCSVIQGYIFSKPLNAAACTDYLLHQQERIQTVLDMVARERSRSESEAG
ncbi:MAG: EAL domain-containing protein [Desulfovibrio sp.]|nr:EAL domain-containing protein [Desulfovibrio sp.]